MIDIPEAVTIARQLDIELRGKRVKSAMRGNSPHKFAFYSRPAEEYAALYPGKTIGEVYPKTACILLNVEPGYVQVLGGGGERIFYHKSDRTLPEKHQLLVQFEDDTYLTVAISGWGSVQLWTHEELRKDQEKYAMQLYRTTPLDDAFTLDYFLGLFNLVEKDSTPLKYFLITKPSVGGIGNGYVHDVLWKSKIHPRRKALDTTPEEREALYYALTGTFREATAAGGRDSERDIYNCPGGYHCVLSSEMVGKPCPRCGEDEIEKISYLGGSAYFCPTCQK